MMVSDSWTYISVVKSKQGDGSLAASPELLLGAPNFTMQTCSIEEAFYRTRDSHA
jgi:hypothetical protein